MQNSVDPYQTPMSLLFDASYKWRNYHRPVMDKNSQNVQTAKHQKLWNSFIWLWQIWISQVGAENTRFVEFRGSKQLWRYWPQGFNV